MLPITGWKRYMLVQPPIMMLMIALTMSGTVLTNLIEYRICTITLGINQTECSALGKASIDNSSAKIVAEVQPQTSVIIMSKSFVDSVVPALLSLFFGPWSDKYGRKPLLLVGYIGTSLTFILLSVLADVPVQPWLLLISSIPSACTGGFCVILVASMCYICDITKENERGWQFGCLQLLIAAGVLIGNFAGPVVYEAYGYTVLFSIAAACCASAAFFLFCIPETIRSRSSNTCTSLWDMSLVKDIINTCIVKRNDFDRLVVWCCILCITFNVITMNGEYTIGYLFASARLRWDIQQYSVFTGVSIVCAIIGTVLGIKVLGACTGNIDGLGLPEAIVAIIAVLSSTACSIMRAFTYESWHMYMATGIGMLGGVCNPMIRAILSKSAPPQDTGKIFSLTSSIETLVPVASASLYDMIYSRFMPPFYPCPVWFLSVGFSFVTVLVLICIQVHITKRSCTNYVPLPQSSQ